MSKDNIKVLDKKCQSEGVNDFIALTENCETARYAPFQCHNQKDYDRAVVIIPNFTDIAIDNQQYN
jgi:hypothetical protein